MTMKEKNPTVFPLGTILVVEDEPRSQHLSRIMLEQAGYQVLVFGEGSGVMEAVEQRRPDIVLLDLRLPDVDGFELCQRIRRVSRIPIIIVSAFDQTTDKIRGLEAGADDYISKPYDFDELLARIEAVLRRRQGLVQERQRRFRYNGLSIDFDQRLVTIDDTEIILTRTEYRLLSCLARHAGRTLVADAVLAEVWGVEYIGDYASLHLYISRLRRKLGEDAQHPRFIITKPGVGYMIPKGETNGNDAPLLERTA